MEQFAAGLGILAGGIAIGGFLAYTGLRREPDVELREATARGGLIGLAAAVCVVVLSALIDRLTA
jgi:hypothetical protein